jgi:hypothetical protein
VTNFTPCGWASPSILSIRLQILSLSRLKRVSSSRLEIQPLQQLAWQALENLRQQQASALAYFDVSLMLAVVTLVLVPVALLMKRSVAEKGARSTH